MLIQINMDMVVMVLDLMHVQKCNYRLLNWLKMLLFLALTIAHQRILIIEKYISHSLRKVQEMDWMKLQQWQKLNSLSINQVKKKGFFSLLYNAANNCLQANGVKTYQFKAKDSKLDPYPLHLGNIPKGFTDNNTKKLNWLEKCTIFLNSMVS